MLEKYFNFTKVQDEYSVIDSFLEHTRIDEEELGLLVRMIQVYSENSQEELSQIHDKIFKIHSDSYRIFENVAEQIIQADFNHQKQYDLFRLYQRIDNISGTIISTSKRMLILHNIGGNMPPELQEYAVQIIDNVLIIHHSFKEALAQYQNNKREILDIIYKIIELSHSNDHICALSTEKLYFYGNKKKLAMGDFRANENIIDHLKLLAKSVEGAATSLEWLLI
ncbi:hypothetical protein DID80_00180 [Candidatus Marinamargulisbacteria bacterium SCGC AAA071-K20]|nr:hypothetical protein DID80_00180 [Candidatus Marinamargulisbacteria bacterium SCGC AAA071-K20]